MLSGFPGHFGSRPSRDTSLKIPPTGPSWYTGMTSIGTPLTHSYLTSKVGSRVGRYHGGGCPPPGRGFTSAAFD